MQPVPLNGLCSLLPLSKGVPQRLLQGGQHGSFGSRQRGQDPAGKQSGPVEGRGETSRGAPFLKGLYGTQFSSKSSYSLLVDNKGKMLKNIFLLGVTSRIMG